MVDYQDSKLWKKTLAPQVLSDNYTADREYLRNSFFSFRKNCEQLAQEVAKSLPEFTIHDITHIDALWEMASIVVPDDFNINPAEAYVLGGAFLLHDLGMALAAYPKGLNELKVEEIWKDAYASLKKSHKKNEDNSVLEQKATEKTLRALHALHAKEMAKISWHDSDGHEQFLIENSDLRSAYATTIGVIAYSHWLPADELENKLPRCCGAISRFPTDWTIDPLKLACILRIADAIHIDDRRAPALQKTFRNLSGTSEFHWTFQNKLFKPQIDATRIVFTSKSAFGINEIDAWWTCYDTLKMIDTELKKVDDILVRKHKTHLNTLGVASIDSLSELSKYITVEGWVPVDTTIKVSNIPQLVNNIGGTQLYGDNAIVPLRELIQNSSDAIRARRLIENKATTFGDIQITIGNDDDGQFIQVEDNGIGMSKRVITGPFLDFGQSFWGSDLMHEELPGLESKGYKSTGRYGIGFFSLFMWGQRIVVCSNRYNAAQEDTLVLAFKKGISSRPILRKADKDEQIRNGGTKVKIWIDNSIIDKLIHPHRVWNAPQMSTLTDVITRLCPSVDCNIFYLKTVNVNV